MITHMHTSTNDGFKTVDKCVRGRFICELGNISLTTRFSLRAQVLSAASQGLLSFLNCNGE